MTDKKISALTHLTSLSALDRLPTADMSDLSKTYYQTNNDIFNAGGGWVSAGDLVYGDGASSSTRLPIGTAAQVLTVNAGATAPEWADATGGSSGGDVLSTLTNAEVSVTTTATLDSTAFTKMHAVTGSSDYTITLPAVSGNAGKFIGFRFAQNAGILVTIDGNGSEKIGSKLTRSYIPGETAYYLCDGVMWRPVEQTMSTYCRAERSANYNITDASWTSLQYDSEISDDQGIYDSVTNFRVTLNRPGRWLITHSLRFDGTTIALAAVGLYLNATSDTATYLKYMGKDPSDGIAIDVCETSGIFAKGDYFQPAGYCDVASGSPQVSKVAYTFFEATWLGH